jgi:predicted phosphodiesterase
MKSCARHYLHLLAAALVFALAAPGAITAAPAKAARPSARPTSPPPGAALTKGPYLIYSLDNTRMTLLWQYDQTTTASLSWGPPAQPGANTAATSEHGIDHQHTATLAGLTPGQLYLYRVQSAGALSTGTFRAAPPADAANVKFLAYGDTRTNPTAHDGVAARILQTIAADPASQSMILQAGDWVSADGESQWTREFFPPGLPNLKRFQSEIPIMGARGNHEGTGTAYLKYYPYPYASSFYYSFDYGPVHIAVLDQYVAYDVGSAQYNWLVSDLTATTKEWKILLFHEPGWSAYGGHPNNTTVQTVIQPLCETYHVDAVVCGHNHYYARAVVNGVQHITAGSAGAPFATPDTSQPNLVVTNVCFHFTQFDIQGKSLDFQAIKDDGTVIDSFHLQHAAAPVAIDGVHPAAPPAKAVGQSLALAASIASGDLPVTYRWLANKGSGFQDVAADAAHTIQVALDTRVTTLTLGALALTDAGTYEVTATNAAGTTTSTAAVVQVVPPEIKPVNASNYLRLH